MKQSPVCLLQDLYNPDICMSSPVLLSNVYTVLRVRPPPCKANTGSFSHCQPSGCRKTCAIPSQLYC